MKKLILAMSVAAMGIYGAELKGSISDSNCGAKHGPGKENAACVNKCIGGGGSPVLVTADGKVVKIHNADAVDKKYYGKAVTIDGKMMDGAVHVDKISE
jgi:hypothetical protein